MAKSPSLLGLWILGICCLLLLAWIYQMSEGFATTTPVPDICGKYGWAISPGLLKVIQQLNDLKLLGTYPATALSISKLYRQYTPGDCDKMGGTFYIATGIIEPPFANLCLKLKDPTKKNADGSYDIENNVLKPYFSMCNGLNSQSTPGPIECSANGKSVGVPNKGLSIMYDGKNIIIPDGTVQLYTSSECNTLQGTLMTVDILEKEFNMTREKLAQFLKLKVDDVNAFLKLNGENTGVCLSKDGTVNYSLACAATGSPSLFQSAWSTIVGT